MKKPGEGRLLQKNNWLKRSIYCFLFLLLFVPLSASAADYYVETPANGGSDVNPGTSWGAAKATIQAALTLATGVGDRVYVAEGTYNERITFPAHNDFQLLGGYPSGGGSQAPWSNATVIDGTNLSGTVVFVPGDMGNSRTYTALVIDGFTIQNGSKSGMYGTGIESWSVDLRIKRCIVQDNINTAGYVGGIFVASLLSDSSLRTLIIEESIVRNNTGHYAGGVVVDARGLPTVVMTNNVIYGNHATDTGGLYSTGGVAIGTGSQDVNSAKITNCTIANNTTAHPTASVGGISVNLNYSPNVVEITNSIVWNTDDDIDDYGAGGPNVLLSYSDIHDSGDTGTGVIHTDPAFVSLSDYHLTAASGGCIDGGTATGAPAYDLEGIVRPQGTADDMGAYEYVAPANPQFTLTTSVVSGNGSLAPLTGNHDDGTVVTLTASPAAGYRIKAWLGTADNSLTTTTNTVTVDSDKTVTVEFELIPIILTTSVTGGHGSISPTSGSQTGGDVVELTTVPEAGYRVAIWTGTDNDSAITSNNFVTMNGPQTVTVQFEVIPVVDSETRVGVSQQFYTADEWVTMAPLNGTNLHRDANGTLHMAFVDNYELWYFKSADNGVAWNKEKVTTALDGKVRQAVMTVDQAGKVFIGFTTNPNYNYTVSIGSGPQTYQFDVHTANYDSGSWVVSQRFNSPTGYGYFVSGMAVDGNNAVHLFTTRYGWYAQGGDAQEYVRDSSTGTWGPMTLICHFNTSLGSNKIIRWYTPSVVDSNGDITLFMKRGTNTDEILFYASNSVGSWSSPVNIEPNMDATSNGHTTFDAAIDENDVIHLVYNTNNSSDLTETLYSTDFGMTTSVIYTATAGQGLYDLKIHSDAEGNLTTLLRRQDESTVVIEKPAAGSWATAYDLPSISQDGDVYYFSTVQTDTYSDVFTGCKLLYLDSEVLAPPKPASPPYGPYGPYTIYYNNLYSTVALSMVGNGTSVPAVDQNTAYNGTAAFTFTPDNHYHFAGTPVTSTCPGTLNDNGNGSQTFSTDAITVDCKVTANFEIDTYTLTYIAGSGGTITGANSQAVDYNQSGSEVTAVAQSGYRFVDWSDGSMVNPRTDSNVLADIAFTANFIQLHTLTYAANANGSITGITPQTVDHSTSGSSITAVPEANFHFTDWSDGVTDNPRIDTNVLADITVRANFAAGGYTLNYISGTDGSLTGATTQTVTHGLDGSAVTAAADSGYRFVDWTDGSTDNPRKDTIVMMDIAVTANFIQIHTLDYSANANGSITGTISQTVDHGSNGTEVTAAPAGTFHFVDWSDGSTENPRTDTNVTGDISVAANFSDQYRMSLVFAGSGSGTVTVTSVPTGIDPYTADHSENFLQGTQVILAAVADKGVSFMGWLGGGCSGTADCTVTMDQAREVTATFKSGSPWTLFMPAILTATQQSE